MTDREGPLTDSLTCRSRAIESPLEQTRLSRGKGFDSWLDTHDADHAVQPGLHEDRPSNNTASTTRVSSVRTGVSVRSTNG